MSTRRILARATMSITAQDQDGGTSPLPRFEIVANTGEAMDIAFWDYPVVIDLRGLAILKQNLPLRFMHRIDTGLGHTEKITIEPDNTLRAIGIISRDTEEAREVVASAKNGFPWMASVGADVEEYRFVQQGETVNANGKTFSGPLYLVTKATLYEISLVDLGGDPGADARLISAGYRQQQAKENHAMTTERMEQSDTHDAAQPQQAQESQPTGNPEPVRGIQAHGAPSPPSQLPDPDETLKRFKVIKELFGHRIDLAEKAISESWSIEQCQLAAIRAERPQAPAIHTSEIGLTPNILVCALRMQAMDRRVEQDYPARVLEAAHHYRGLSLVKLADLCAKMDGLTLPVHATPVEIVKAAFSTRTLTSILKESAQKLLLDGYQSVDPASLRVARILEAVDFKTHTLARLTGQYQMEKVANDGELPHAEVTDQGFSIKVDTYGRLVGLTRQDVINDDLGAFLDLPRQIGRGAALALESAFWSMVEGANGTFFAAANNNVISGATSAFGIAGLNAAIAKLRKQKDPAGNPIRARPRFVAVPPDLEADAVQIYTSNVLLVAGSTDKTIAANNPHANKYEPVVSEFLTGNGASSVWYLVADPADVPAFGIAFLRGQQAPTIEEAEPDPKYLGRLFRGYFDFGVALLDPRGAVRAAGA